MRSILLLSLGLTLPGCIGGGDGGIGNESESRALFENLLNRGRNQPVSLEEFEDGENFTLVEEAYADAPSGGARVDLPTLPGAGDTGPEGPGDGVAESDEDPGLDDFAELVGAAEGPAAPAAPPLNPYLEFGKNIIWYPLRDGDTERLIMKPYTFPFGTGEKIFKLMQTYANFPLHAAVLDGAVPDGLGPQPQGSVLLDLRKGFSVEAYSNPRPAGLTKPSTVEISDVIFVTATANELAEVEHFVDLFAAEVRQIEIEAKIVEVTTREELDLGIRKVDDATPIFGLPNAGTFVNGVDFSFGNTSDVTEALFSLGAVFDGVTFNAVLEAVANFENVSIISRPKVAVREGGRADIVNVTRIPFYNVTGISASGIPTTSLQFQDVGVQMYVIPRLIGRDTVILNIDIEASQATGTAASFVVGDSIISVPQISKRNARTIVRLEPGQAVILGGLISERNVERESKVPLLGSIPLLGQLFKSKITSKEQTNVLFFIRPRILEGSDLNSPFE